MNWFDFTTPDGTPTQCCTYHNVDSVVQGEQRGVYPTEFLNSLSMSGVPPHTLTLQEGCSVILLRNMPSGLANGIRFIVVKLMQHIIDVEIATGPDKGRCVFIPRLNIIPSDTERMPFTLRRPTVLVAARICHDYQQGPGVDVATLLWPSVGVKPNTWKK
jgi:hypothetical protein